MVVIHSLLCLLLLMSGFLVCSSKNPVESVLFLILTFCNAAAISFILHAEFLGLIFIIVYVGAVAVLFLFVIMMLNIKTEANSTNKLLNYPFLSFCVSYLFAFCIFLNVKSVFCYEGSFFNTQNSDLFLLIDDLDNIDVIGQVLFNYYLVCFLLAGLILLVALIGSIILTLRFNKAQESQFVSKQLARSDSFISFFK